MITVNNETIEWQENLTVSRLLVLLKYKFPLLIIRINGKLIPRTNYKDTFIKDKDEIKIIHLMSGG